MKYWLRDLDFIDDTTRQQLVQVRIRNTDQLLGKTGFPHQRTATAREAGIPEEELLQLATVADLLRVKGVGPKLARLLSIAPGIRSVQDLAQGNAKTLQQLLKDENAKHRILSRPPNERLLAECIEEARELRTRLVLEVHVPLDFRTEVRRRDREEAIARRRQTRHWIPVFAFILVLLLVLSVRFLLPTYVRWPVEDQLLAAQMRKAERVWFFFNLSPVVSVSLFLIILLSVAKQVWNGIDWWLRNHLRFRLFNRAVHQNCYLAMIHSDPIPAYITASAILSTVIAVLALGAFALVLLDIDPLSVIAIGFPPVVTVIALFPDLRNIWLTFRRGTEFGPAALHRYLGYRLLYLISALLWLLIVLQVFLPITIEGHRLSFDRWVIPTVTAQLDEISQEVASVTVSTATDAQLQTVFLARFERSNMESSIQTALLELDAEVPLLDELLPQVSLTIVWLLVLVTILYFVVPFVLLGKLKFAALFLVIVGASEGVEFLLEKYAPSLFFLPKGSLVALLLIAALFLANSIVFDWFYQETTEEYKQCLICGRELDAVARYCSHCGSPQPVASTSADQ